MGANGNQNSKLTEPNLIKVYYFKLTEMTFSEKNLTLSLLITMQCLQGTSKVYEVIRGFSVEFLPVS